MNWFWIVGMLFAGGSGFFSGTTPVSVGLRRDIADLEAERLAFDLAKSAPKPVAVRPKDVEAHRILRAALIRAGMANANEAGWWQ